MFTSLAQCAKVPSCFWVFFFHSVGGRIKGGEEVQKKLSVQFQDIYNTLLIVLSWSQFTLLFLAVNPSQFHDNISFKKCTCLRPVKVKAAL